MVIGLAQQGRGEWTVESSYDLMLQETVRCGTTLRNANLRDLIELVSIEKAAEIQAMKAAPFLCDYIREYYPLTEPEHVS